MRAKVAGEEPWRLLFGAVELGSCIERTLAPCFLRVLCLVAACAVCVRPLGCPAGTGTGRQGEGVQERTKG